MSGLFRKKILDDLNSPEELDQLMSVLDSKMWLAMITLACSIAGVIVWGVFGTMPHKVNATGILINGNGIISVPADTAGNVEEIFIQVGDKVSAGQTIATVSRPDLLQRLRAMRRDLALQREKYQLTVEFNESVLKKVKALSDHRVAALHKKKKGLLLDVEYLEKNIEKYNKLIEDGLITDRELELTKAKLRSIYSDVGAIDVEIESSGNSVLEQEITMDKELYEARMAIKELGVAVEDAYGEYRESTAVASGFSGKVVELKVTIGDYLEHGAPVCSFEQYDKKLIALIFVDAAKAKNVEPGMPVHVSPSAVQKSKYGSIISFVTSVGQYPVSRESLTNLLGQNTVLAESLVGGKSVIAVTVDMLPDSTTPTGYRWSSSKGPNNTVINAGTICTSAITVQDQMPMTLLLPFLNDLMAL